MVTNTTSKTQNSFHFFDVYTIIFQLMLSNFLFSEVICYNGYNQKH